MVGPLISVGDDINIRQSTDRSHHPRVVSCQETTMKTPSSAAIFNKLGLLVSFVVLFFVSQSSAQVEECPRYCSPVNNNYGQACGSVAYSNGQKTFKTFANICELFKQRCENRRSGRPAIEFVNDGPCASQFRSRRLGRQSDEMQVPEPEIQVPEASSYEVQRLEVSNDEVQRIVPLGPKKLKALPVERTPSFVPIGS